MTSKEMLEMRVNGSTYQEIADICGITRQAVHERVTKYFKKVVNGKRGRNFTCVEIIYEGIYDHFEKDENETLMSLSIKVFGDDTHGDTLRNCITGKHESRFTINQIKKMCEVVGKSFEETFRERKQNEEQ